MSRVIQVLVLEDRASDAELMIHELRAVGIDPRWKWVVGREDFLRQLNPGIDLILADFSLPRWDALGALQTLEERGLDIPFIVVTGSLEENAIECMKQGADDYILKDRMGRLGHAAIHALEEKRLRLEKRQTEAALRESEERFRNIVQSALDAIIVTDGQGRITLWTPAARRIFGYDRQEILRKPITDLIPRQFLQHGDAPSPGLSFVDLDPEGLMLEGKGIRKDGSEFPVELSLALWQSNDQSCYCAIIARDISERKRAEEEILTEKHRTEAVIEHMADGLLMLDKEGKIVSINPAAERMLGVRAGAILGRSAHDAQMSPSLAQLATAARPAQGSDAWNLEAETTSGEINLPHPRVLRVHYSMVRDRAGQLLGEVLVLHDITRQRALEQAKDDFIATISHELRTPLFSIQGALEMILADKVAEAEKREHFLELAYGQSRQLRALVEDLLDVSKMEAGRFQLKRESTSITDVVNEAIQRMQIKATRKHIDLQVAASPNLPRFEGDAGRLVQAVANLIDNAVKFSPEGTGVMIRCRERDGDLQVEVIDQGVGIPEGALPQLFQRFHQVDNSATRKAGGAGLGLYIVKQIIDSHGGKVWVESIPGEGARFSFSIPTSQ